MRKNIIFLWIFSFFLLSEWLIAGDPESYTAFNNAREKEKAKKYLDAASGYLEAQIQADDPVLKANSLMCAARCYRRAGQYCEEFDCLQQLAVGHPGRVNFTAVVDRQYEIADECFAGHRDYFLSWIPFLKKDDRTTEFMQQVLENAPCAAQAPETRMRLARIYLDDQKPDKAAEEFLKTIKLHPGTQEAKFAVLELANVYLQQAKSGDGDGQHAQDALEVFDQFIEQYPDAPECEWVRRSREKVFSYIASRYCKLGEFYRKQGQNDTAQRYFAVVLRDYPNTPEAVVAEKNLSELDEHFLKTSADYVPKVREFKEEPLPAENQPVIGIPEESGGHWLMPVRDLKQGIIEKAVVPEETDDDAI